jgi:Domain of unknown function (DUF4340)
MAMKTEQKIYTAAGVLALFLGGLFLVQKNARDDAMAHSQVAAAAALPEIKLPADDADKITKIQIKNAAKGEVVLEKQGDTWKVTKPVNYPANQANVKSLIDNMKEIRLKDSIDTGSTQYASYELDGDKTVHVQLFKDNAKAVDLYFGKSGTRGQMTRLADKEGVYVASGYSAYLYTREVKEWRDRDLLKFEDANVVSATLNNENGNFSFSKNDDKWTGTHKGKPIANLDVEKVKEMVRAFKSLIADDFADDKTAAETGLTKPATVAFVLKDDGGTIKLNVGSTATGSSRYAQKEGSPIVVINSFAGDWATAALSKFQKADAAPAGKDAGAKK